MDVAGGTLRAVEHRLVRLEHREDLALVVHRAAGIEVPLPHRGLEGRGHPLLQRLHRLDIVVSIDEHRRGPFDLRRFGPDRGMSAPFQELDLRAAQAPELRHHPIGGLATVGGMIGEGADAGDGKELGELLQPPIAVCLGDRHWIPKKRECGVFGAPER